MVSEGTDVKSSKGEIFEIKYKIIEDCLKKEKLVANSLF